jgi:hypothetical protein
MSDAKTVIDWNGQDLPAALVALPPGRYRVERIEGPADEPSDAPPTPDKPDPSGPGDAPSPPAPSGPGEA